MSWVELIEKRPEGLGAQNQFLRGVSLGIWTLKMLSGKVGLKECWMVEEHQDLVLGSMRLEMTRIGLKGQAWLGLENREGWDPRVIPYIERRAG
jgi:hypothetical protein